LPFAEVERLALGWAFHPSWRHAGDCECLTISGARLPAP
jgi:uncharacterized membrane protein